MVKFNRTPKGIFGAVSLLTVALAATSAYPAQKSVESVDAEETSNVRHVRPHTDVLRQTSETAVPAERVFKHRPTVIFRDKEAKKKETVKVEDEKFLFPSPAFLTQYEPWKFKVEDVWLLGDNVATLKRRHPDCRRIDTLKTSDFGKLACSNTSAFRSEGDEVIFTYAKTNEIITAGVFAFQSEMRARRFVGRIQEWMKASGIESFVEHEDQTSLTIDTPMISVSLYPAQNGYFLVDVRSHFDDRISTAETYAKAGVRNLGFGNLSVGQTRKDRLPDIPKTCENVTADGVEDTKEYYGMCFDFPYESHMQLDFNPVTGILKTAVLSPIGAATGGLIEDMLTRRYGLPKYCRQIVTDTELVSIKSQKERGRMKTRRMYRRPANVFAGTCDVPIVYSTDMRYVFENINLNTADIMADFERRKSMVDADSRHSKAFDERLDKVKGFFD